jgi:hypothetical protein
LSEQHWLGRAIFVTSVLRSLVFLVFGVLQLARRQESQGSTVIEKIEVCRWLFLHWKCYCTCDTCDGTIRYDVEISNLLRIIPEYMSEIWSTELRLTHK